MSAKKPLTDLRMAERDLLPRIQEEVKPLQLGAA